MLSNRISKDERVIDAYNSVLSKFIRDIAESQDLNNVHRNEMLPMYTSFLIGHDTMCLTHAHTMIAIDNDS